MKQYLMFVGLVAIVGCADDEGRTVVGDAGIDRHVADGGSGGASSSEPDARPEKRFDAADGANHPLSCPREILHGPDDQVLPPSAFDASTFGCYPDRVLAPDGWVAPARYPACPGASDACTYSPAHLPCGSCDATAVTCGMSVYAPCNCGAGLYLDAYWDAWVCQCISGQWDCRINAPSGASCFLECDAGSLPDAR